MKGYITIVLFYLTIIFDVGLVTYIIFKLSMLPGNKKLLRKFQKQEKKSHKKIEVLLIIVTIVLNILLIR